MAAPAIPVAMPTGPDQARVLQQATTGGGDLSDTSWLSKLSDTLAHPFKVGFSESTQVVFLLALGVMIIGLIVVFFLPEIPLAQRSAQAQREADILAAENSDGVPGEVGAGPLPDKPDTPDSDPVTVGKDGKS